MLPDFWTDSKVGEPGSKSSGSRKYVSIRICKGEEGEAWGA